MPLEGDQRQVVPLRVVAYTPDPKQRKAAKAATSRHAANVRWKRSRENESAKTKRPTAKRCSELEVAVRAIESPIDSRLEPENGYVDESPTGELELSAIHRHAPRLSPLMNVSSPNSISIRPYLPLDHTKMISNDEAWSVLAKVPYTMLEKVYLPHANQVNPCIKPFMQLITSEPAVFHAVMLSQLYRDLYDASAQMPRQRLRRLVLEFYAKLVQSVQQQLEDPVKACSDSTILAIEFLAIHSDVESDDKAVLKLKSAQKQLTAAPSWPYVKQGPFETLLTLHLYGGPIKIAPVHLDATVKLTQLRGGVHELPNFIRQQVSYVELIEASSALRRPRIGFASFMDNTEVSNALSSYDSQIAAHHGLPDSGLPQLGHRFEDVYGFCRLTGTDTGDPDTGQAFFNLRENLRNLTLYTLASQHYVTSSAMSWTSPTSTASGDQADKLSETKSPPTLALLGELRNYVQHHLLATLPKPAGDPNAYKPQSTTTSEITSFDVLSLEHNPSTRSTFFTILHLSALAYSYLCVFPIPHAPFDMLSRQIQFILQCHADDLYTEYWGKLPRLYEWLLFMLGVICPAQFQTLSAVNQRNEECHLRRAWVVQTLCETETERLLSGKTTGAGTRSWEEVRTSLMGYSWLPETMDEAGRVLWSEVLGVQS